MSSGEFDTGFSLLPSDDETTPDQRLEAALSGLTPTADPDTQIPFGRGWDYDFVNNTFLQRNHTPAEVSGTAQLRVWIEKTLRTARFAHPIYDEQYGVDGLWEAFGHNFNPGLIGRLEQHTREALLVHDRITQVTDFTFDGSANSSALYMSFRVLVDDDTSSDLSFSGVPLGRAM